MAERILAAQHKPKYSLTNDERLALIAQTRRGQESILIERQRAAFIQRYGDPFGQEPASATQQQIK